jgi:hypothetical protein
MLLISGDSYKAKRVLEKAILVYHPNPIEAVKKALTDLVGHSKTGITKEQLDSLSG